MKISVLGDGGWGTTLSILLHTKGFQVKLWGAFSNYIDYLKKKRINSRFLPGIKIPRGLEITANLKDATEAEDLIVLAIPSQHLRRILKRLKKYNIDKKTAFLSVTKGIEINSLMRMSKVIEEELGNVRLAVLSGPTIAYEVARKIPTTAVIASSDKRLRQKLADVFSSDYLRVYTNSDVIGVELGGALKNIIAIACGISDGLGFGTNTKAALLSRGLAEISRLGIKLGARQATFSGISGLGDLVTTCVSPFSRNRSLGEEIAKGKSLKEVVRSMQMVAEGVPTVKAAYQLSRKYKVKMPITCEIYYVLYKNKSPRQAVKDLMTRELKEE